MFIAIAFRGRFSLILRRTVFRVKIMIKLAVINNNLGTVKSFNSKLHYLVPLKNILSFKDLKQFITKFLSNINNEQQYLKILYIKNNKAQFVTV